MPIDQPHDQEGSVLAGGSTPGSMLQQARLDKSRDEKWVAEQMHITVHYVKAIEGNKFEKLPGIVFARGYLKSYAKLVGLDPEAVLAVFNAMQSDRQEIENQTRVSQERVARNRNTRWAVVSVASLVLLIGAALYFSGPAPVDSAGTQTPPAEPVQEEPRQEIQQSAAPSPELPSTRAEPLDDASMAAIEPSLEPVQDVLSPAAQAVTTEAREPEEAQEPQESQSVPAIAQSTADRAQADEDPELAASTTPTAEESAADSDNRNILAELAAAAESARLSDVDANPEPRPEDLTNIDVLEGENGERIIAVNAQGEDFLRIKFSGESWVEINDGEDRQIYRDLREQGDVLEVSGHAPFNVLLGDAPLAQINFNGADIDVSGNIRIDNSARLTVGL